MGPPSLPPSSTLPSGENDSGAGGGGGGEGGREGGPVRSRRYAQQGQQVEGWVARIRKGETLEQELSQGELTK